MRILSTIVTVVLFSQIAFAQEVAVEDVQNTEVQTEEIGGSKDWSAYKVTGHSAWGKEACVASTSKDEARLEVYAEKATDTAFTEPTVQVLVTDVEEQVYSATLETNKGKRISLTLASQAAEEGMQVVMARLKDRASFIRSLRRDSTVRVKLRNLKGRTMKSYLFSLRGSSKTINAQFESCDLTFNTKL